MLTPSNGTIPSQLINKNDKNCRGDNFIDEREIFGCDHAGHKYSSMVQLATQRINSYTDFTSFMGYDSFRAILFAKIQSF